MFKKILKKKYLLHKIGALTSKPYAFIARPWELQSIESIDTQDSISHNIVYNIIGKKIMRVLPVINGQLSDEWITNKTRYSFDGFNKWRFNTPMIKWDSIFKPINWILALKLTNNIINNKNNKLFFITNFDVDASALIMLKYFALSLNNNLNISNSNLLNANIQNDLTHQFIINNELNQFENINIFLLIGSNLRLESPLINLKLIKNSKKSLIGYIGPSINLNYNYKHIGINIKNIIQILEGKHWFTTLITKFYKKFNYKLNYKINFLLGENMYNRLDNKNIQNMIEYFNFNINKQFLKKNKQYPNINYIFLNLTQTTSLFLNIKSNMKNNLSYLFKKRDDTMNNIYNFYLMNSNINNENNIIKKKDNVIFQGNHYFNYSNIKNLNIILPSLTSYEKLAHYINNFGELRKSAIIIENNDKSRNDWRIFKALFEQNKTKQNFNLKLENLNLNYDLFQKTFILQFLKNNISNNQVFFYDLMIPVHFFKNYKSSWIVDYNIYVCKFAYALKMSPAKLFNSCIHNNSYNYYENDPYSIRSKTMNSIKKNLKRKKIINI